MTVTKIKTEPSKHFFQNSLDAIIYQDVFNEKEYNRLKFAIISLFDNHSLTYKTHRTNFNFGNKNFKIISHAQNAREQQVVFDLTFEKDYFFQTNQSVKNWSDSYLLNNLNPVFYRFLKFFENQQPFKEEPGCWMPLRWHCNILAYTNFLTLHFDMSSGVFNVKSSHVARAKSITFYLYDHEEGMGGEFWSENGFVYKPKQNTAICVNGNSIIHGVNANNNPESDKKNPRLAFTTRWVHKDDLYLPGHPDKSLYKLDFV